MVRLLVDTCAVSALWKPIPNPRVVERIQATATTDLFLSVLTLGELARGILLLPEGRRRLELTARMSMLEQEFANQVLPIDRHVTSLWAELSAQAQTKGTPVPLGDALIAATALRHGLHVLTRNTRHFVASGALVVNPWDE